MNKNDHFLKLILKSKNTTKYILIARVNNNSGFEGGSVVQDATLAPLSD